MARPSPGLLVELAERYGTPLYVYDYGAVEERLRLVEEALSGVDHVVAYAAKAAPILDLLSFIAGRGAWVEAVSGGELYAALTAGVPPGRILVDGVSKSPWEIRYAVESHVYSIHAESIEEVYDIDAAAREAGARQRIGVRLNLAVPVHVHRGLATATRASKFGVEPARLMEAADSISGLEGVELEGLHFHLGSGIEEAEPYLAALAKALDLAVRLEAAGHRVRYIDAGGGYTPRPEGARRILEALADAVSGAGYRLVVEPGKLLVADAGVLVTRVNYVKEVYGRRWALVDAGMNDYIRPMLYGAKPEITCLTCRGREAEVYSIGGPVCESTDVFAEDVRLPHLRRGDLLALWGAGAYGWSMSSCYNMRLRAAVVAIYGGKRKLIVERCPLSWLLSCQKGCGGSLIHDSSRKTPF